MSIASTVVWELRSGATAGNVNGGGFNPANANFFTDGAATLANTASPVFTSVSYSFVNAAVGSGGDVGAWLYIQTSTGNWAKGWYQIVSVSGGAATLAAAVGQGVIADTGGRYYNTNTVAGCATVASPTAAKFTIDYSQQGPCQQTWTNLGSASGSTTLTDNSSLGLFTKAMVGNFICINSGANASIGWYEIVSFTDSNNVVLDRTPHGANTMSATTGKVGGALSLGSSTASLTDASWSGICVAGNFVFVQGNGTYTLGASTANGNGTMQGYNAIRGDLPTDSTRPIISCGAFTFAWSAMSIYSIIAKGTAGVVSVTGNFTQVVDCQIISTSTSSGNAALTAPSNGTVLRCDIAAPRCVGISGNAPTIIGCYIHDCNQGIFNSGSNLFYVHDTIIAGCVTAAITTSSGGSSNASQIIKGNTIYGAENKLGTGILNSGDSYVAGTPVYNNIFYGLAAGINPGVSFVSADYNDYYNNTADISGTSTKGRHDQAVNPAFTNVAQITGTTATTTAGNHLVQTGATFITSGVTPGRDFVYINSGTGVTTGIYDILSVDSETQITTGMTLTANATGDKHWQITTGRNFLPTGAI